MTTRKKPATYGGADSRKESFAESTNKINLGRQRERERERERER